MAFDCFSGKKPAAGGVRHVGIELGHLPPRLERGGRGRVWQGLFIILDDGHMEPESPEAHISTVGAQPRQNTHVSWPPEGSIGSVQERKL